VTQDVHPDTVREEVRSRRAAHAPRVVAGAPKRGSCGSGGTDPITRNLCDEMQAGDRVTVGSAGSTPASEIQEGAVAALEEIGLDAGEEFPKPLADEFVRAADVVVTMGCGDACPVVPGKRHDDWEVADPAGRPVEKVRAIREEIRSRVTRLLGEIAVRVESVR
jgi:protein-tyrosine-phosphatase